MHICYVCNEYPPGPQGGIGTVTQTLGRALVRRGHEVSVVGIYSGARAAEHERAKDDQGVRVLRLPHARIGGTGFVVHGNRLRRALVQLHRQSPIDLLEGQENSFALLPRRFVAPKLIRMHGGHHFFAVTLGQKPRPWRSWLERRSFNHADHLCAVSQFVADSTRQLLHLGTRAVKVLPNPVDLVRFRAEAGGREEDGLIVFVGTVCEKKGVRQLVQAMPRIVQEIPRARLCIVGRDWLDARTGRSFTEYLRTLIAPELSPHIEFTGAVDHGRVADMLARATVCVYPSHMEAMPVAWLEGMAMGKPLVVSRTGPGPEVIDDGVTGLCCDPHDPASIAERVVALLKDEKLRVRLGRAASARARDRFSVEALVIQNEAFYERCIHPTTGV